MVTGESMDKEESMENQQQPQQEWTLQCSGLRIRQGDLIECEVAHRVRVATVKNVTVVGISMYGTHAGEQVVHVQLYQPARREGSGDRYVPATSAFRVLDAPPVPPALVVELLYPKHAFHRYAKGKTHIVRHEITPLWGLTRLCWRMTLRIVCKIRQLPDLAEQDARPSA